MSVDTVGSMALERAHGRGRQARSRRALERCSDGELVGLVVEGDEDAYETLVRRHHKTLYGLLIMETSSVVRAEDALQETMLTLARSAATIREPDHVLRWLRRVARNTVRHRTAVRRANRESGELRSGRDVDGDLDLDGEIGTASDPALSLVDGDPELDRAIRALPPDQRRAVWLTSVQGWTHTEIADVYDVPVNTVSSWIRRGLKRLEAELGSDEGRSS